MQHCGKDDNRLRRMLQMLTDLLVDCIPGSMSRLYCSLCIKHLASGLVFSNLTPSVLLQNWYNKNNAFLRTFLMVQCFKTSPSNAEGAGSTPGQGAKILHASQPKHQNIKQKQCSNKFVKFFRWFTSKNLLKKRERDTFSQVQCENQMKLDEYGTVL